MSLLAPSSSHIRGSHREHEPLPSLPPSPSPSPTEEEDLANGSAAWKDTRDEIQLMVKKDVKGKGKAREVVDLNQDDDDEDNYGSMTPVRESSEGVSSYPPTTEEEEEARRVEEVCGRSFRYVVKYTNIFLTTHTIYNLCLLESTSMGTS